MGVHRVLSRSRKRGRHRSLFDFMGGKKVGNSGDKVDNEDSRETIDKDSSRARDKDFYEELLDMVVGGRKNISSNKEVYEEAVELSETLVPSGKVLEEILGKGLGEDIRCDSSGKCSDGKRVGEIFTDRYGFKRQRGYVNTTRLPIYVDWIVEEAVVSKVLPKAYSVKTSRGSLALIPEDYLCELHTRYGVILKNYSKCSEQGLLKRWGNKEKGRRKKA